MAAYEDFDPPQPPDPAAVYKRITDLLVGAYSVEVLPDKQSVILRVWYDPHCDPKQHKKIT